MLNMFIPPYRPAKRHQAIGVLYRLPVGRRRLTTGVGDIRPTIFNMLVPNMAGVQKIFY